jgi:hypothetical protein
LVETIAEIVQRGSIYVPPDNRKCFIKRLKLDGTYDADWLDVSQYIVTYPTIKQGVPDDIFLGEYKDEDVSVSVDNSQRKFNDTGETESLFYGYRTRYKTLFKFSLLLSDKYDNDVEALSWYGISFSNPSTNDAGEMSFTVSSTVKILSNYSAVGIDLTSGTTAELVTRLLNKTKDGVSLFARYFTGFIINPDSTSVTTITHPLIEDKDTVLDKLQLYSFYDDFFYYVDNDGNLVWTNRIPTATVQWELNGAGQVDSSYPVNIVSIDEYYNDTDNVYTKVALDCTLGGLLKQDEFKGVGYDDGTATYLSEANSATIYAQLKTDGYIGTDSRLTQLYVSDRTVLDAYLLASWTAYQANLISKLDEFVNSEKQTVVKEASWTIGDGSQTDIYGEKLFKKSYPELTPTEALAVATRIYNSYYTIKSVVSVQVFGAFQLQPKDKIEINYRGEVNVSNPFIIGVSELGGTDVLAGRTGAIRLVEWTGKILTKSINLDNFDITYKLREV